MESAHPTLMSTLEELCVSENDTKEIFLGKKRIIIRKLTLGDLADINKVAKDDPYEVSIGMIFRAVVEPKMTLKDARNLKLPVAMELGREIVEFSEISKEALEKARNLLKVQTASTSS